MKRKFTDWFQPEVKPTIPGVYEIELVPYPFHYWDGKQWLVDVEQSPREFRNFDPAKSEPMPETVKYIKTFRWRGLAANPHKGPIQ